MVMMVTAHVFCRVLGGGTLPKRSRTSKPRPIRERMAGWLRLGGLAAFGFSGVALRLAPFFTAGGTNVVGRHACT